MSPENRATGRISGTVPAVPTHLTRRCEVDEGAQEETCRRLVEAGVDGLLVLGSTGEGMALDEHRRRVVVRIARETADGSIPVVVGCAGNSTTTVLGVIEIAAQEGSQAVLVPPPFYYLLPEEALVEFYTELAERSPLPIILYHIPELTKNRLSAGAIRDLASHPNVIGLKDSDGDLGLHLELIPLQGPGFCLFQGVAALLFASYSLGWGGSITPVGGLVPRLERDLRRAVEAGEEGEARRLGASIAEVASVFRHRGMPLITNVKGAFEALGHGERWTEPPIPVATDADVEALADRLAIVLGPMMGAQAPRKGGRN